MSGAIADRPALQALIAAARQRLFDVVLFDDLSRLARDGTLLLMVHASASSSRTFGSSPSPTVLTRQDEHDALGHPAPRDRQRSCSWTTSGRRRGGGRRVRRSGATFRGRPPSAIPRCPPARSVSTSTAARGRRATSSRSIPSRRRSSCGSSGTTPMACRSPVSSSPSMRSTVSRAATVRAGGWSCGTVTRILTNTKYIGHWVWNKTGNRRDLLTGRRKSYKKPEEEWDVREFKDLRIVPQELWDRVAKRRAGIRAGLAGRLQAGLPVRPGVSCDRVPDASALRRDGLRLLPCQHRPRERQGPAATTAAWPPLGDPATTASGSLGGGSRTSSSVPSGSGSFARRLSGTSSSVCAWRSSASSRRFPTCSPARWRSSMTLGAVSRGSSTSSPAASLRPARRWPRRSSRRKPWWTISPSRCRRSSTRGSRFSAFRRSTGSRSAFPRFARSWSSARSRPRCCCADSSGRSSWSRSIPRLGGRTTWPRRPWTLWCCWSSRILTQARTQVRMYSVGGGAGYCTSVHNDVGMLPGAPVSGDSVPGGGWAR